MDNGGGGCELVPDTVVLELEGSAEGAKESTSREDPRVEEGNKVL